MDSFSDYTIFISHRDELKKEYESMVFLYGVWVLQMAGEGWEP